MSPTPTSSMIYFGKWWFIPCTSSGNILDSYHTKKKMQWLVTDTAMFEKVFLLFESWGGMGVRIYEDTCYHLTYNHALYWLLAIVWCVLHVTVNNSWMQYILRPTMEAYNNMSMSTFQESKRKSRCVLYHYFIIHASLFCWNLTCLKKSISLHHASSLAKCPIPLLESKRIGQMASKEGNPAAK